MKSSAEEFTLSKEFAASASEQFEQVGALLERNADVAEEPILIAEQGTEYAVHRVQWHDFLGGDIDILDTADFMKEKPRTLEEFQQDREAIDDARRDLMKIAHEAFDEAAMAGHWDGVLPYDDPSDDNYTNNVQETLRKLSREGNFGGDVQDNFYQGIADQNQDYPKDVREVISKALKASVALEERAKEMDKRGRYWCGYGRNGFETK